MIKIAGIYVPIDFSECIKLVPPEEEIVYSSMFSCYNFSGNPVLGSTLSTWTTHGLITNKGYIMYVPGSRIKGVNVEYFPLSNVRKFSTGKMYTPFGTCEITTGPMMESKQEFKERKKQFKSYMKPIRDAAKKYWKTNFSIEQRNQEIQRINDALIDKRTGNKVDWHIY